MSQPYRIALAGLGTVGVGVAKILKTHTEAIARKAGRPIEVVAVSARDKSRNRGFDFSDVTWVEDASTLVNEDVDCIVEMIGGEGGVAKTLAESALAKGLDFVTANKALLAHHGYELAKVAEGNNA
ncbi:MAG: homoserine dehydrogenase, partial [Pseudomonadota bacterium]|nr:homoserine dehydrogenase [Pseudomonadota bacterium]